jgi:hypothetical protein
MKRRLMCLIVAAGALSAGTAAAQPPTHNSGYGWWPGGFGFAPLTMHAPSYPCSVTVYGPTFNSKGSSWNQNYGGGTSCSGGVGQKTLTVYDQVLGQDGHTWYTLSGSTFTAGPSTSNPVRLKRNRAASLGHVYRAVAKAKLVVPNGHAGCSLTNTCDQTLLLTAVSRRLAP